MEEETQEAGIQKGVNLRSLEALSVLTSVICYCLTLSPSCSSPSRVGAALREFQRKWYDDKLKLSALPLAAFGASSGGTCGPGRP